MKNFIVFIVLLASISTVRSETITPALSIEAPYLLLSEIELLVDFGVAGENIEIQDLWMNVKFDNEENYFDSNEGLSLSFLVDIIRPFPIMYPSLSREVWLSHPYRTSSSKALVDIVDLNMLYIDSSGFGYIKFSTGGGDGVIINSISITGNATITTVPLPPSLWLFASSLFLLCVMNIRTKCNTRFHTY